MGGPSRPLRLRRSIGEGGLKTLRGGQISRKRLLTFVATGAYSGYVPVAPATAGSFVAACLILLLPDGSQVLYLLIAVLVTLLAVPIAGEAEKIFGHDGKPIVVDEWAGMCVSFLFLNVTVPIAILGFLLFRAFDILKVFPADRAQRLRGGWGVVGDDVVAGFYTCGILHIALHVDVLSRYLS